MNPPEILSTYIYYIIWTYHISFLLTYFFSLIFFFSFFLSFFLSFFNDALSVSLLTGISASEIVFSLAHIFSSISDRPIISRELTPPDYLMPHRFIKISIQIHYCNKIYDRGLRLFISERRTTPNFLAGRKQDVISSPTLPTRRRENLIMTCQVDVLWISAVIRCMFL